MLIAMLMAIPAQAQFGFGLRGGMNLSNMAFDGSLTSSDNQAGFFVGPTAKFTIPIIGIGIDASLMYDQRKMKVESSVKDVFGNAQYESVREENIVLPINLRYTFGLGDIAGVFVKAGPQWSWNIGGKSYTLSSAKETFQFKKSALSVNIGAGAVLMDKFEVFLNYNWGLGKSAEFEVTDAFGQLLTSKMHSNAWQLGVAYYF